MRPAAPRPQQSGLTGALARQVARRVPPADLAERDPAFISGTRLALGSLVSRYFRAEVRDIDRVPATGPVLLVGNHSGGNVPADTLVFTFALIARFGAERPFYQLAHDLVSVWPFLGFLRRYGTVPASRANARLALEAGGAVLVYPGGDYETHRPSWESARVEFDHREGFLKLAHELAVPIVPVVSIGGQETALFLTRGERLAHLLRLDRAFRLKVLPISIALPWGLNVGDLLGHLPLPAKVTIQVLEPIDLRAAFGPAPDFDEVYANVTGVMQRALDGLAAERRLPLLG